MCSLLATKKGTAVVLYSLLYSLLCICSDINFVKLLCSKHALHGPKYKLKTKSKIDLQKS